MPIIERVYYGATLESVIEKIGVEVMGQLGAGLTAVRVRILERSRNKGALRVSFVIETEDEAYGGQNDQT